ncbi:MAG: hypothetical protein ACKVZJ_11210 [Phycisphaerales bacterium]
MSLWQWLALIGAAFTLVRPFAVGMYDANRHGLGVLLGLRIGYRLLRHEAQVTTLMFLIPGACVVFFMACAAVPAYVVHLATGQAGATFLAALAGGVPGAIIAVRSANRVGEFVIRFIPFNDHVPCAVCRRLRAKSEIGPCPECGEPAPAASQQNEDSEQQA